MNTAVDILNAFRACKNSGEQIDLFESLAISPEPPIEAFVEILKNIRLEAVLLLAIQAFAKVTDPELRSRLKGSNDLLELLSKQAQSGSTDIICWAAARTIEDLEFDFVAVSQYLSEEPKAITQKILQSKLDRFTDSNLLNSSDYNSFVNFWTYGAFDELRAATVDYDFWSLQQEWLSKREQEWKDSRDEEEIERLNKFSVCLAVMNSLGVRGLKKINTALQRAEEMGEYADTTDENQMFEALALLSLDVVNVNHAKVNAWRDIKANYFISQNSKNLALWKNILLHCLQSNNSHTRFLSAYIAFSGEENIGLGKEFCESFKNDNPIIASAILVFCEKLNSLEHSYNKLEDLWVELELLSRKLKRKKVRQDCNIWRRKISNEIQDRNNKFEVKKKDSEDLRANLDYQLKQIRDINPELYEQIFSNTYFDSVPQLTVDNDRAVILLEEYDKLLKLKSSDFNKEVNTFYHSETRLKNLHQERNDLEITKNQINGQIKECQEKEKLNHEKISSISRDVSENLSVSFLSLFGLSIAILFLGTIPTLLIAGFLSIFIGWNNAINIIGMIWLFCAAAPAVMGVWGILTAASNRANKAAYENSLSSLQTERQALEARNRELNQQLGDIARSIEQIIGQEKNSILALLKL